MTSFRRAADNFALDRAIEHAQALKRPLVVFEPLRVAYPFASDRLHAFVLEGMADNARRFEASPVHYLPWVETRAGEGQGLLEWLAREACVVVGDDWPGFFVPRMQAAAFAKLTARCEVVDSNGLYPMHDTPRVFTTAHSYRAHLQKVLGGHLGAFPSANPLKGLALERLKAPVAMGQWRPTPLESLKNLDFLAKLPIDHSVKPAGLRGGATAAHARLAWFLDGRLEAYPEARNEPEVDGTSQLSAWLHFGQLSSHQVFRAVAQHEDWSPARLGRSTGGAKAGWWGMSAAAEAFLDQLVTWRELAFNMSSHCPEDATKLSSLPAWALATIDQHRKDRRPQTYTLEQLERGRTHDPLWNATQMQLVREGWFHNYLRMLWGKKIYQWSPTPEAALEAMETLMGKYSLDGRDPVSWSGYLWVMGRYDRAWGPERSIFGKLRYMTSENTARKVSVKHFIEKYAP